jgi:HEAT repeat protein
MFRRFIPFLSALTIILTAAPAMADIPVDCRISPDTLADIRQMLTAEDNALFDLWTAEELFCACATIYYTDPEDADFHDRVMNGAVVLLGQCGDPRAVGVLIDAIETHPAQALYALGNYSTPESVNALVAHIRDDDGSARENAAEGLRNMQAPSEIPEGWEAALSDAIAAVDDWIDEEPFYDVKEYFMDAKANLEELLTKAQSASSSTQ